MHCLVTFWMWQTASETVSGSCHEQLAQFTTEQQPVLQPAVAFSKSSFKHRSMQIQGNFTKLMLHLYKFRYHQMHFFIYNTISQHCYTRHVSAPIMTPSSGVIPRSSHKIRMFHCRFEQYITYTLSGEWVHQCLTAW
jgi:hypothetical protein